MNKKKLPVKELSRCGKINKKRKRGIINNEIHK